MSDNADGLDVEDTPVQSGSSNPLANPSSAPVLAPPVSRAPARSKWDDEDQEDEDDVSHRIYTGLSNCLW